ncbi:uncharacterized protein LOC127527412 [Erpetoichthys calabaricus]|uniref:uncharacterized protein LOC127527412 n=1 Tax=Erpetoichthys calabaricus TaxID=27687 RepID=UPI002234556B|nr:uncharacterized protein LOC127527412 [Erpetoichthys calabaricus]
MYGSDSFLENRTVPDIFVPANDVLGSLTGAEERAIQARPQEEAVGQTNDCMLKALDLRSTGQMPEWVRIQLLLHTRVGNVKRDDHTKSKRKKATSSGSDPDKVSPHQHACIQDTYGCVNWCPDQMPLGETVETQKCHKRELKKLFLEGIQDSAIISQKMVVTYYSQRKDIINNVAVETIIVHFKQLSGIHLEETMRESFSTKGKRVLAYMRSLRSDRHRKVVEVNALLKTAEKATCSKLHEVPGIVLLLFAYFNENENLMFYQVSDTCLTNEVSVSALPASLCIIFCGDSLLTASCFMLSVDKNDVKENIPVFLEAFEMMFAAYYIFNIQYPSDVGSTLEFIQRQVLVKLYR